MNFNDFRGKAESMIISQAKSMESKGYYDRPEGREKLEQATDEQIIKFAQGGLRHAMEEADRRGLYW